MLNPESKASGIIIVNKPSGPTSHDIINRLRKITGVKKIGHAGTLDPFASGVLLVAVGRVATRELGRFVKLNKDYRAVLRLGAISDTYDRTGSIKKKIESKNLEEKEINKTLKSFVGEQAQVPPMYSAKKVKGKKLYQYARQGIEIKREPVKITIYKLELMSYHWPRLEINVSCSSGTYIRTLAHDIGQYLGCGAYLVELERTAVGEYGIDQAIAIADITARNWAEFINTLN